MIADDYVRRMDSPNEVGEYYKVEVVEVEVEVSSG